MANFFSFTRNQGIVLLTLFFVLVLGAVYFFIYIPGNENELEEQRFRYLRKIEKSIHAKIDNAVALLNNELVSYENNSRDFPKSKVLESIKKNPTKNLVLFEIDSLSVPSDSAASIIFNDRELIIYLAKGKYRTGLKFTINQFIDSLLPRDVFNEYILLKGDTVIYQSFPIGVTDILKDSLLTSKSVFAGNGVRDITLSGTDFKLFSQQFSLNSNTSLTVSGLLTRENYTREKTKLPDNIVLLLLTLAISTILALPWIKLYQMGSQDRLTVADNLFSFGVSMLLMSLLFFGFFKYNIPLIPVKDQAHEIKQNLADSIETAFSREIGLAYKRLTELHEIRKKNNITYSLQNFEKSSVGAMANRTFSNVPLAVKKELDSVRYGLDVSQVFWLGNDGTEVTNWAAASENTPPGNFGNRDYFRMLMNNNPFLLDQKSDQELYLEQVVSWTSGKFRSVLSKRYAEDEVVAAISLDLKSVKNAVLPAGFLYSIINEQGKVLYNSNPSKNLNENLIEEFSEHQKIKATVLAGSPEFFKSKYIGNEYNVFIKRMTVLPYYIVIMENTTIGNVRDMKIFGFTLFMLLAFFLFLVIKFATVFFISRKRTFFTKQYLDISWIGPHKNFYHIYNEIIFWNILNMVVLVGLYHRIPFLTFLFALLISSTTISILLNYLFLKYYKAHHDEREVLKNYAIIALVVILVIINVAAFKVIGLSWLYPLEILWIFLGVLYVRNSKPIFSLLHRFKPWFKSLPVIDFRRSFSLMVFTRLIISAGIPAASFYTAAYDYETNLISKYRHTKFIKDILEKTGHHASTLDTTGIYPDKIWISEIRDYSGTVPDAVEEEEYGWLFDYLTSYNIAGANELYRHSQKKLFVFKSIPRSGIISTFYNFSADCNVRLTSAPLRYQPANISSWENIFRSICYLVCFGFALLIFGYALHRMICKLFALDLPPQKGWQEIDDVILTGDELNGHLFVIGAPGTDILAKLKTYIKEGKIKVQPEKTSIFGGNDPMDGVKTADMLLVPSTEAEAKNNKAWGDLKKESLKGKYGLVIVDHFEYDIQNPAANQLKIEFLESLLLTGNRKVIVISTLHPVNFLDSLNQQELTDPAAKTLPQHSLDKWYVLLGHFRIVIEKLTSSEWEKDTRAPFWQKLFNYETKSFPYLAKLNSPILAGLKEMRDNGKNDFDGSALAFKTEISSSFFYMHIWQSLTKEEKFLLYDLAEDGLVNPFDEYNLTLLISKGLILQSNSGLLIFNKGFRDFILTSIGASEALKIRDQIRDNGNWNKLKTPLKILVFAVLAFLFTSQQEAYSTLLKYLSIMTAAFPAALKFFSLFDKSSAKSS